MGFALWIKAVEVGYWLKVGYTGRGYGKHVTCPIGRKGNVVFLGQESCNKLAMELKQA